MPTLWAMFFSVSLASRLIRPAIALILALVTTGREPAFRLVKPSLNCLCHVNKNALDTADVLCI